MCRVYCSLQSCPMVECRGYWPARTQCERGRPSIGNDRVERVDALTQFSLTALDYMYYVHVATYVRLNPQFFLTSNSERAVALFMDVSWKWYTESVCTVVCVETRELTSANHDTL